MNVLEYWNNVCTAHTLSIWTSSIIPNHNDTNSLLVHLKRKWKTKLSGRKWTKSIISMSAYHSQRQDVCRFRSTCPCHIYLDVPVRSGNTTWKNRNAMAKNTDIYWFVQFRLFENCSQGKCRWWRQTHTHMDICAEQSLWQSKWHSCSQQNQPNIREMFEFVNSLFWTQKIIQSSNEFIRNWEQFKLQIDSIFVFLFDVNRKELVPLPQRAGMEYINLLPNANKGHWKMQFKEHFQIIALIDAWQCIESTLEH